MKRCFALLIALMLLCLWGCGNASDTPGGTTEDLTPMVGIALPEESERFSKEGQFLRSQMEAAGYEVVLEFAGLDASLQVSQVQRMLAMGADCLIIAAVDPMSLAQTLEATKVPVIAYDRELTGCEGVDLAVLFDGYEAGKIMAQYVVEEMALDTALEEQRSHTIEFFMGAPEDSNALNRYRGIMAVLQPYLDSGVLQCLSGRVMFEDTCTIGWEAENAQENCRRRMRDYYEDRALEICVAASDVLADGVAKTLQIAKVETWPVITGQEMTLEAARRIAAGQQVVSALYDYDSMAQVCARGALALLSGSAPEINGGTGGVDGYLCYPQTVDKENYKEMLIDSGRYKESDIT